MEGPTNKDAVETMGMLLPKDAAGRDAVHVAVFSAHAPVRLFPGQDVGLVDAESVEHGDMVVSPLAPPIGIVDPFLKTQALPGDRFWVYLYPRTITGLAHRWRHPAFESGIESGTAKVPSINPGFPTTIELASKKWLWDWCAGGCDRPSYDQLMDAVRQMSGEDEYLTIYGSEVRGDIPGEIWGHIENVLLRPIEGQKPTYFSCAC